MIDKANHNLPSLQGRLFAGAMAAVLILSACAVPVAPAAPSQATPATVSSTAAPTAASDDAAAKPQATSTSVTIGSDAPAPAPEVTIAPTAELTDSREMVIAPAILESLELQVLESQPVQVNAIVKGTLGDGCTKLNAIEQKRDGDTFTIDVTTIRPKEAMCTMIAKLLNETVALDVAGLKAGTYIVAAGTLSQTFTLAADN